MVIDELGGNLHSLGTAGIVVRSSAPGGRVFVFCWETNKEINQQDFVVVAFLHFIFPF
jgi:hypothetical protein